MGRHWSVSRGLARMLLAMHAATRGLALCACFVLLVQCVGVFKLRVGPNRISSQLPVSDLSE